MRKREGEGEGVCERAGERESESERGAAPEVDSTALVVPRA